MRRLALHHWILLALVLGAGIGLPLNWAGGQGIVDPEVVSKVAFIGKGVGRFFFLRLLQMLVVPLIVASLITGVTSMGNLKSLGNLGGRALMYYLSTSMLAILTGLIVVNIIQPGRRGRPWTARSHRRRKTVDGCRRSQRRRHDLMGTAQTHDPQEPAGRRRQRPDAPSDLLFAIVGRLHQPCRT